MSARAWQRRRETKRFTLAIKRALAQIKAEPSRIIYLREWGIGVLSPEHYDYLTGLVSRIGGQS